MAVAVQFNLLSYRVFVAKHATRQCGAQDDGRFTGSTLTFCKCSPREDGNAHGLEVSGGHPAKLHHSPIRRQRWVTENAHVGVGASHRPSGRNGVAERKGTAGGDALESCLQFIIKRDLCRGWLIPVMP